MILTPTFSCWLFQVAFDLLLEIILDLRGGKFCDILPTIGVLRKPIAVEAEYQIRGHGCKMFVPW